ncbi:hypothetical protein AVEN_196589-1, partial [Araneus ventricosus]
DPLPLVPEKGRFQSPATDHTQVAKPKQYLCAQWYIVDSPIPELLLLLNIAHHHM